MGSRHPASQAVMVRGANTDLAPLHSGQEGA